MAIEVGATIDFPFAGKTLQGTVVRVHEKTIVLRADFPKHPGKIIRRKRHALEAGGTTKAAKAPRRGLLDRIRGKR